MVPIVPMRLPPTGQGSSEAFANLADDRFCQDRGYSHEHFRRFPPRMRFGRQTINHHRIDTIEIIGASYRSAARRTFVGEAKYQNVLTIPPFDPAIPKDRRTDAIQSDVAVFRE